MRDGAGDLERDLMDRESEQKASQEKPVEYDPEDMIRSFDRFVETVSSHEGAQPPPGDLGQHVSGDTTPTVRRCYS